VTQSSTLPSLSPTERLFDSLPATSAEIQDWDEANPWPAIESFLSPRQLGRLVTEDHCFICRRSTDHRGEDHPATQALVARFAASVSV
jgi:hypothetical protein